MQPPNELPHRDENDRRPYRFLDYYQCEEEDIELFTGRAVESAKLVSDAVNSRFVVLIAPTGMGKSSLINAGARPGLEELGFCTMWVPVKLDPLQSLRDAIKSDKILAKTEIGLGLADTLRAARGVAGKRLVVFFDQFEEFFLYLSEDDPQRKAMIQDIASIYRDRGCGIYIVISLREDFFANLEAFIDEIPSIYQSGSTLRLRAFDLKCAREAIVVPATRCGIIFDEELIGPVPVDGGAPGPLGILLKELQENGRIPPTRLQIVCSALWEEREGNRITMATYKRLGGAEGIVRNRFRRAIEKRLDDSQLELFQKVIPHLCSNDDHGTKQAAVPWEPLAKTLGVDKDSVNALFEALIELQMIRKGGIVGTVEWVSDYLSGRVSDLQNTARAIYVRRLVTRASVRLRDLGEWPGESSNNDLADLFLSEADWDMLSKEMLSRGHAPLTLDGSDGSLDEADVRFLLIAALEHGGNSMSFWRRKTTDLLGDGAWEILERCIISPLARPNQAQNVIRLLAQEHSERALRLLDEALNHDEWISYVVEELGKVSHDATLSMLEKALNDHPLRADLLSHISGNWTAAAKTLLIPTIRGGRISLVTSRPDSKSPDFPVRFPANSVEKGLPSQEWALFMRQIQSRRCLPVIGNSTHRHLWREALAADIRYPEGLMDDFYNVAQFVEATSSRWHLISWLQRLESPEITASYCVTLAVLPLPIYVTSQYGLDMERALEKQGRKPRTVPCFWRQRDSRGHHVAGSPDEPVVFHVNGTFEYPDSLVLTADDQTDFLANISADPNRIPIRIRAAVADGSTVYLDYGADDLDFNILRRSIEAQSRMSRDRKYLAPAAGFLPPEAEAYLKSYLDERNIYVLSQSPLEFATEVAQRWEKFQNDRPSAE